MNREEQKQIEKIATDAATGVYEDLATQYGVAETSFHTHNGVDSPFVNYSNLTGRAHYPLYRVLDSATDTSTGLIGGDLVMPYGGYFNIIGATVDTAGVTGTMVINVLLNGTTIFMSASTRINIATTSKTSRGNAVQPAFAITGFNIGDILTFNVTAVQGTPAQGLTFFFTLIQTTP